MSSPRRISAAISITVKVTRKQHFIDAALFWTLAGAVMSFFGFQWVWLGFEPKWAAFWALTCVVLGLLKGRFAIGKSARRSILRIENLPEPSPFYKVFSKGTWALILGMTSLGMIIRHLHIAKAYRGLVLAVIGIALLWASRYFWNEVCKFQSR